MAKRRKVQNREMDKRKRKNTNCDCVASKRLSSGFNSVVTDENTHKPTVSHRNDDKCHASNSKGQPSSEKSEDDITPALNKEMFIPGAPRILLLNQQVNAEGNNGAPQNDAWSLEGFPFHQHLRTPPSSKCQKLYFKGRSPDCQNMGFDRFERVSDEIILKIFHFLPRHRMCVCALVCRRWARIVCDISLWKHMDMGSRYIKEGVLKIILERGVEILRLNQAEIMGDFNRTVLGSPDPRRSPLSEDRLYRLQFLDLSMANVNTSLLEAMLKFCPNLRKISLENIQVSEQLLINLGLNSPYLETLNLCMCQGMTPNGLQVIFQNCLSLSELNIAWIKLSQLEVTDLTNHLPSQMTALNISGHRSNMTNEAIEAICQRCPSMKKLDLSDSSHITDEAVDCIVDGLVYLTDLCLSRCYSISVMKIDHLVHLRHLENLNVYGITRTDRLRDLEERLSRFKVNKSLFSQIARPTTSNEPTVSIWDKSFH